MSLRYLIVLVSILFIYGCASTKSYLDQTPAKTSKNTVRIHLEHKSGFSGSANATLLTDSGEGADYNAVIAINTEKSDQDYLGPIVPYLGPMPNDKADYGNKPLIGEFSSVCGIDYKSKNFKQYIVKFIDENYAKIVLSNFGNFVIEALSNFGDSCPTSFGNYSFLTIEEQTFKQKFQEYMKSQGEILANYDTLVLGMIDGLSNDLVYGPDKRLKFSNYRYLPTSVISEVASGDSITWTRPEGTMEITGIRCQVSCGGEDWAYTVNSPPPIKVFAGKDYYIRMDIYDLEVSDRPFK